MPSQKEHDLAISDLSKAIELEPNDADAYIGRGNAYADTRRFANAIADYQRAIALTNNSAANSYVYCVQGVTYTKMGDFESAIASLEQGVKIRLVASENSLVQIGTRKCSSRNTNSLKTATYNANR